MTRDNFCLGVLAVQVLQLIQPLLGACLFKVVEALTQPGLTFRRVLVI